MNKPLPIVNTPTLVCTLPVSGNKIKYRPFVVKEQKALLLAQQSEDQETITETVKQVISSATNGTLVYDAVPTADIAYFFLQLRIASVGPEVRFTLPCISCEEPFGIELDMSLITVDMSKSSKTIMVTDDIGITFRYPTIRDAFDVDKYEKSEQNTKMLIALIENIFDADTVYPRDGYTEDQLEEWLVGLNDEQIEKIQHFIDTIPELSHTVKFTCPKCNTEQSRLLEGLHSFFRLGDDS